MRPTRVLVVAAVLLSALTGCQKPDVGARCKLAWSASSSTPAPTPGTAQGDYFETGNTACDDLICIVSPATTGQYSTCAGTNGELCGYCSKPCVSNADCFSSDTGLVCDKVVLDEAFIATLPADVRDRYLGDIATSSYCVVPSR